MTAELPAGTVLKELSARINHHSIPRNLLVYSTLPEGQWGRVVVSEGEIFLHLEGEDKARILHQDVAGLIPPGSRYKFSVTGHPGRFQIFYYHQKPISDAGELAGMLGRREAPEAATDGPEPAV